MTRNPHVSLDRLDRETREIARQAARKAGMTLDEWVASLIAERSANAPEAGAAGQSKLESDIGSVREKLTGRGRRESRDVESMLAAATAESERRDREAAEKTAAAPAAAPAPAASSSSSSAPRGSFKDYAMAKVGSAEQFGCLEKLWGKESGWNPNAQNPTSTAYGIPQFLNSTWASTGIAKTSDGYRQIDAGLVYIDSRYGSPCGAWSHSQSTGWY